MILKLISDLVAACTGADIVGSIRACLDPRARRGDRGSGLARAWKQSQAVIIGGVSLEAASPARQDDAETAPIMVNGREGLYEHGHPSGGGKQRAPCQRSHSLPSCWTSKGGASTWCIGFVFGGKVAIATQTALPARALRLASGSGQ